MSLAPCEGVQCGKHAFCRPDGPEAYCVCEDGWSFDPNNVTAGCMDVRISWLMGKLDFETFMHFTLIAD